MSSGEPDPSYFHSWPQNASTGGRSANTWCAKYELSEQESVKSVFEEWWDRSIGAGAV